MVGRHLPHSRLGWLVVLPLCAALAGAVAPPLADYTFDDGERKVLVKVPDGWVVQNLGHGLQAQKDGKSDLFGTATLSFHEYDQAPTPDQFLDGALSTWAKQYSGWRVLARTKSADRPRVRLATVGFTVFGFPCRGYIMAVIGQETGTLGFCYAETVMARQMRLDDLVQLLVAGSYGAFPVRGEADNEAVQAVQQAVEKLYGDGQADFKQLLAELQNAQKLDAELLGQCGQDQPALRTLKGFFAQYLSDRPRERIKDLAVFAAPTAEFNALAFGRNELGPGFVVFHAGLTRPFRLLAQHYCHLRNQGLAVKALGPALTSYSERLARAVLTEQTLPPPGAVDFSKDMELARYEKVFYSMIGLVLAHELAHYYSRHAESGQDPNDPFSIQQRELDADAAAIANIQLAADKAADIWEGGVIQAFGFLATVDNVAKQLTGQGQGEPEYTRSHPLGTTRLRLAVAKLGEDDFRMRNDPWTQSQLLETSGGGVEVVGGLTKPDQPQAAFVHPLSKVEFTFPAGWVGSFDPESNVVSIRLANGDNLPLALYSCGGQYSSAKAITTEIFGEMKKSAQNWKSVKDTPFDAGNPKLKVHLAIASGRFAAGDLSLVALGIKSPGWNHGIMLMTPTKRLDQDVDAFQKLVEQMKFTL